MLDDNTFAVIEFIIVSFGLLNELQIENIICFKNFYDRNINL